MELKKSIVDNEKSYGAVRETKWSKDEGMDCKYTSR